MLRHAVAPTILAVGLVLGGCAASGPKYSEIKSSMSALTSGHGRIYFYRPSSMYGAVHDREVRLNDSLVGKVASGSFFFVDREPGSYAVAVRYKGWEPRGEVVTVALKAGQTFYVETVCAGPVLFASCWGNVIEESVATKAMTDLNYMGQEVSAGSK